MRYSKNNPNRPPMKEEFRITKTDIRAAVKNYNQDRTLKSGLQEIITHIAESLKWNSTSVEETVKGMKKVLYYTYNNPTTSVDSSFRVVLYPSGNVSIADQPVVIGDKVAQLSRMFRLANVAAL